jgi:hypothetical protein
MVYRVACILLLATLAHADLNVRDGRVSADLQSQPLTQVLERLKAQTNMKMVVDEGITGKTVSAKFQNLPVGLALKKILEGTGINYAVLGGADGQPQSVFIGGSTRPGAPPRRLDSRPVGNRGVVTPVNPPPPPPLPIQQDLRQQEQPQQNRPQVPPPVNVPTGGGFVPEQPKTEQQQPGEPKPEEELDNDRESED